MSRIKSDDTDPDNLIPIAFHQMELEPIQYNPEEILNFFYRLEELGYKLIVDQNSYMIMTRGAAKQTGARVPEVHGANKPLDPDLKPEKDKGLQKQVLTQPAKVKPNGPVAVATGPAPPTPYLPRAMPQINLPVKVMPATPLTPPRIPVQIPPRIPMTPVQIRPTNLPLSTPATVPRTRPRQPIFMAPIKRENVPYTPRKQLFTPQQKIVQSPVQTHDLSRVKKEPIDIPRFDLEPDPSDQKPSIPAPQTPYIHPTYQSPQQPEPQVTVHDLKGDPWLDPKAEPPLEESAVDAQFRHPMQEDFIIPPTLAEATKNKTLLAKDLPKQTDIDRLMKVLNRKILAQSRFPEPLKDLEASYIHSGFFKDIYEYIKYNKLPTNQAKAKQVQINSINYFTLGSILFRLIPEQNWTNVSSNVHTSI